MTFMNVVALGVVAEHEAVGDRACADVGRGAGYDVRASVDGLHLYPCAVGFAVLPARSLEVVDRKSVV